MTFMIYLLGVIDNLQALLGVAAIFAGITAVIAAVALGMLLSENEPMEYSWCRMWRTLMKRAAVLFCVCLVPAILCPDSRTLAAMWLVPKMAENVDVQEITGNGLEILKLKTRQWAEELADPERSSSKAPGGE